MPRGRSGTARLISRRYPKEQALELVGDVAKSSIYLESDRERAILMIVA
jgi:hypothetical protein